MHLIMKDVTVPVFSFDLQETIATLALRLTELRGNFLPAYLRKQENSVTMWRMYAWKIFVFHFCRSCLV